MNGRYSGIGTVCPESSSLSKTHPPKPAVKCLDRGRILGQVRRLKLVTAYSREILCISPQAPYDSIQSCLISVLSDEAVRLSVYSGNSAGSAPIG
ncbi:hypothetical protein BN1708_001943 [Verticillium longisporum]|uniref:Uncharacterized protein n=1 Tax=Verticillium longisporum TaxID=100787 RepID=A0A0G4KD00_VERLO|nr:hypothetical protein BN1708_001943 [Verticillium longisporum]